MKRIAIFGNSGAGKSTMAVGLAAKFGLAHLDLDTIAWDAQRPGVRLPDHVSARKLMRFIRQEPAWVIEGCYAGLLRLTLAHCTEVRFLNPGVETCLANCLQRPWEPHKYSSAEGQDRNLQMLLDWVRRYPERDDEYSLSAHLGLYKSFGGPKREFQDLSRYVNE